MRCLRESGNCDSSASCLMFFKICRSSTADEDAYNSKGSFERRAMPSLRKAFQNTGMRKQQQDPSKTRKASRPQNGASVASGRNNSRAIHNGRTGARREFVKVTAQGLGTEEFYSNPENLPSLEVAYQSFKQVYPRFKETYAVDAIREREYEHLGEGDHVCFDYSGFGLFSHRQQVYQRESSSFNLAYISANLPTHALYGTAEEGTVEAYIRRRIMNYMNLSDSDYSMVFTASRGTAYKLLAESYPFNVNNRLLTVYDYESDAVSWMAGTAKEKGAKIMNASFKWPNLKILAPDLKYKLQDKKKKKDQTAKGLFVFPVQSRVTGAKYSYQWMSQAQANKWHVLLDASALAPKDLDSLAFSLFRPEFIVTSFYKVFGADPTGFGCLFIKNSIIQGLHNSDRARGVGMVRIIPSGGPNVSLPRDEGQRGSQERLPDIHETETEEYLDAADYVDPVSAFSGPMAPFYVDSIREMAVIDRITASGREMNIAGFDDSSGRTSLPSENEEDWDDRSHGESQSGVRTHGGLRIDEDCGAQELGDFSGRESGSGEIEEEPSEQIFPLTRRGQKSGVQFPTLAKEMDARSPRNEEDFSGEIDTEILDEDDVRILGIHDEALTSRGDNNRFLSRIQEEETDEGDDFSPPHLGLTSRGDSPAAALGNNSSDGNGSHAIGSPLFHSPSESTDEFEDQVMHDSEVEEAVLHENKGKVANEVGVRSEADVLESNIMFKDDRNFALREGRDADSYFEEEQRASTEIEDFNGEHLLGSSGANGRRLQSWSPGEGTDEWEAQYVMSEGGGSSMYADEEGPVVCYGLDHADSQGLNKTNLRLRFLINWLIHALLKLRHPAHLDTQGTNLVHIYGPEVLFDRGHALAFNLFDWNGVPVRAELVQRLADRSNISLGLGTLCNIVYPEGPSDLAERLDKIMKRNFPNGHTKGSCLNHEEDFLYDVEKFLNQSNFYFDYFSVALKGLWFNKNAEGGTNPDGKAEPARASNASKHDRPSEIPVVTAALGFVSTFEDVYRLWAFVAKFLDADFVKREEWLYHSLNQEIHVL